MGMGVLSEKRARGSVAAPEILFAPDAGAGAHDVLELT